MNHHRVFGVLSGLSLCVLLMHAGCSSDATTADAGASSGGSTSSSSTSASSTSASSTSSGGSSGDSGSDAVADAAADAAGGCQAGGLTPPAAGKTVMEITFSDPQGGYNGPTTYTPPAQPGLGATSDPSQWYFNVTGSAYVRVVLEANPTLCKVYPTVAAPSAGAPSIQLSESSGKKQWWCGGSIVVDSIVGKEVQFHFDGATCVAPNFGSQEGTGTVKMTGKGASTFF